MKRPSLVRIAKIVLAVAVIAAITTAILYFQLHKRLLESFVYSPSPQEQQMLESIQRDLIKVDPRAALVNIQVDPSKTYTLNKRDMFLCVRDADTEKIYDRNMLFYASLHELAHSLNPGLQHDAGFYAIFGHLLARAEDLGLYDKNYQLPEHYCSYRNA